MRLMDDLAADAVSRAWLADWRRRVAELHAEVRALWPDHPERAWDLWRTERERLYLGHPQSPVPVADRAAFRARHWPYDARLRFEPVPEAVPAPDTPATPGTAFAPPLTLPNSGSEDPAFDRLGRVTLPLPGGEASLSLFWMRGYAGGLFLPFGDATNGVETYGAGRYVLDTAKGADLGGVPARGMLVVDLNFAFQPSCAFDPRWACPLAPPENRLAVRVEAGERLR
jgi:uncharacterized protein (DUF1684 family)